MHLPTAAISLTFIISGIQGAPHKGFFRASLLPGQPLPLPGVAGYALPTPGMVKVTLNGQTFMTDVPPHIAAWAMANRDATIPMAALPPHMMMLFPNGLPASQVEVQPAGVFPGLPGLPPPPPGLIGGLPGAPIPGVPVPVAGAVVPVPTVAQPSPTTTTQTATQPAVNGNKEASNTDSKAADTKAPHDEHRLGKRHAVNFKRTMHTTKV